MNIELWRDRFCEHLVLKNRTGRTIKSYRNESERFLAFLNERSVESPCDITREDVLSFRVHLHEARKPGGEPLSIVTQATRLAAVMSFLRYLHDEKYLLANPGEGVPRPKLPDALPSEIPTEEEVLVLLQVPDTQDILGLRDRAVLELLYSCALRNAELRQLSIEDLDLHRLEVRILKGKGQKGRVLPVGEPAALWIERFLQKSRPHLVADPYEESLFVNSRGLPLSGEVLSKLVSAYAKKAKLSMKVTPHVLRHACATHMLARRAGIRYLQKFLGHAAATTTERYTRVEISDLREVYLRCHPRENP